MPVEWTHITNAASQAEPLCWLLVFASTYKWSRFGARQKPASNEEFSTYGALRAFVVLKFLGAMVYPILISRIIPFEMGHRAELLLTESIFWSLYFLAGICVFFMMAEILRKSLQPLPGLSTAALIVFRWAAILATVIALTAHLPSLRVDSVPLLLNEISLSFVLCICAFELSLLGVLLRQIRRLGMCLRSRPIGFAIGLCALSLMDLCNTATFSMSQRVQNVAAAWNEITNISVTLLWAFYILRPEPKRLPHALSPASRLMKWNEIALKLGVSGKQAEQVPFISGVESTVDAILERFKGRVG